MTETLYLKYRPETFKQVIGHAAIVRSLQGVLEKKTNHTFMLSGPSGTGKTTLARIAATTLGCAPSDVQEIDAATFTGIDDMRGITAALHYRPLGESASKVIIIDECQALTKAAWQSLLKSLEEPPAWVYWFLCTTDPAKVPANIQTRCTKYELKPVALRDIEDLLFAIYEDEKMDCPEDVVILCAKEAQGSPRAALVNLGACAGAKDKREALELLQSAAESNEAVELARALVAGKPWETIKGILTGLEGQNAESVRHVVRAYVTKVIMGSNGKGMPKNFAILEAFGKPFPAGDGISPLLLAVGELLFA